MAPAGRAAICTKSNAKKKYFFMLCMEIAICMQFKKYKRKFCVEIETDFKEPFRFVVFMNLPDIKTVQKKQEKKYMEKFYSNCIR